jgi:hypothetical protein
MGTAEMPPLLTAPTEHLKHVSWEAYRVESYVNWCGHGQEIIPFPLPDGSVRFKTLGPSRTKRLKSAGIDPSTSTKSGRTGEQ